MGIVVVEVDMTVVAVAVVEAEAEDEDVVEGAMTMDVVEEGVVGIFGHHANHTRMLEEEVEKSPISTLMPIRAQIHGHIYGHNMV